MSVPARTNQVLIEENALLTQRIQALEQSGKEQKRLDKALRESEEKYRLLVENANEAVYVLQDGIFRYANKVCGEALGIPVAELIGRSMLDFLHPDHREKALSEHLSMLCGDQAVGRSDYCIQTQQGVVRLADVKSVVTTWDENVATLNFATDITDRRRVEEELRKNEEMFRKSFQTNQDAIGISRLADGMYLLINQGFSKLTGYTESEILGRTSLDINIWKNPADREQLVEGLERDGKVENLKAYFRKKDGSFIQGIMSASVIDLDDAPHILTVTRDITEQTRAENALRESEEKFRVLADSTPTAVLLYQDDRWIYANKAAEAICDYSEKELRAMNFWDIVHPDFKPLIQKHGRKRQTGEKTTDRHEFKIITKDGMEKWIDLSGASTMLQGRLAGIISVLDITARKRTEDALRESEEKYRGILESIEEGYFETDLAGNFTFANDAECRKLGYSRDELIGMNYRQYTNGTNVRKLYELFNALYRTGEPIKTVAGEYKRKDGTKGFDEISVSLIRDAAGKPIGFRGLARDVTERKKAEQEKRRLEERLRTVVDTIPDLIWLKNGDGVYLACNRMFELFFGAREADIVGKTDYEFVDKDLADSFRENDRRAIAKGKACSNEEWITFASDGHRVLLETIKTPMYDSEEALIGILGIGRDITDRVRADEDKRRLEERLQRAEKMEALGTLAGGVAHDLNNVLGVISGYAELLLMASDESSPDRPRLINIMKGGERAAAIVQDLLTLARRGVPGRDVLNLNRIVTDCLQSPEFEKLLSYHPYIRIKTDLEADLLNISGSSVHLGKSLFNLVSNASDAMAKGGVVTVRTANRYLDQPIHGYDNIREGDYVVLTISDTGEGIPEADRKRIFEPFYTKKVMGRSGTGLGLAVVWGTVKDHNGYINVESKAEKGSTFTLYFPVTREDMAAQAAAISISDYTGRGEAILVVDDVKEQRDLAAEMLRTLHYNVATTASGEEAVAYLRDHDVDLMVLDMIMDPGMDGLDTYRSLLAFRPQQKAIIVSGFSESDRVHAAQALGAGAYVKKPYVMEKLGLAVKHELARSA